MTGKFKARLALAALKGGQSGNELAALHQVYPTQVTLWKKQLAQGNARVFRGSAPAGELGAGARAGRFVPAD